MRRGLVSVGPTPGLSALAGVPAVATSSALAGLPAFAALVTTSTNGAFAFALVVLMLGLVSVDNVPTNAQQECLSGVGENDGTLLAVLGVLSHAPQQRLRDAWRRH